MNGFVISEKDILALIGRLKQKITRKMNLRLAGLVIFVLLFSIASHSLTNSAFAINTSHEKSMTNGDNFFYKINVNVAKDPSVEKKAMKDKEKAEAVINHLKEMAKSKLKGYSEK